MTVVIKKDIACCKNASTCQVRRAEVLSQWLAVKSCGVLQEVTLTDLRHEGQHDVTPLPQCLLSLVANRLLLLRAGWPLPQLG